MKYRPKYIFEYVLLRGITGYVSIVPYRMALLFGWCVAGVAFYGLRWKRAEAERRIAEVFGDKYSKREISHIAWLSMRNFAFTAVETLRGARLDRDWMDKYVEYEEGFDTLTNLLKSKQGAIVAVIHAGNWDAASLGMQQRGIPIMVIARNQKNPLFNQYFKKIRAIHNGDIVSRDDPKLLKKAVTWLKSGKVLAIMVDIRVSENATILQFLGKEAALGRGIGVISRHSGAPILPVITLREGWAQQQWKTSEPIWPDQSLDKRSDSIGLLEQCLNVFEQVIRENPDQYLWYNKRWVLEPPSQTQ